MPQKIKADAFYKKLTTIAQKNNLLIPAMQDNRLELVPFSGQKIYTGEKLPYNSVKEILLPQRECLVNFEWNKKSGYEGKEFITDEKQTIIFTKPCDAHSVSIIEKIFLNDKTDIYYQKRRQNLLIIALGCISPGENCFCTSVGGNPFNQTGSDLLCFADKDEFYFIETTSRGKKFIEALGAQAADNTALAKIKTASEKKLPTIEINMNKLSKKTYQDFNSDLWAQLGEICLGCGACTYLCPTCHCFDIQDEEKGSKGVRVRNWDSCQFSLFTKHASGHNPRSSKKERMRQRFEHKLSYMPENINQIGCVGCGRCGLYCPVNIDIQDVVDKLTEGTNE